MGISEEQVFENVRIILVEPQHPGNIGASARAMKNMGFNDLWLVVHDFAKDHIALCL